MEAGFIKAGRKPDYSHPIQIASVQTLCRRSELPDASLIIIDEAHHCVTASYSGLFDKYPSAKFLGVTATPQRNDGQGFEEYFDDLVLGPEVSQLIQYGYLCDYKLFATQEIRVPESKKSRKSQNGDYTSKQLKKLCIEKVNFPKAYQDYGGGSCLVFAPDVSMSKLVVRKYNAENIPAAHLDGETPSHRRQDLIRRFRDGEIKVLSNVAIFTEGFDLPTLNTIQILRPTRSQGLWLQMLGRVLRAAPNKAYATIIDHTDNYDRLGLPDTSREWRLAPVSLFGKPPFSKRCQKCFHIFRPLPHELHPVLVREIKEEVYQLYFESICPSCKEIVPWSTTYSLEEKVAESSMKVEIEFNLQAVMVEIRRLKELKKISSTKRQEPKKSEELPTSFSLGCLPQQSNGDQEVLSREIDRLVRLIEKTGWSKKWAWSKLKQHPKIKSISPEQVRRFCSEMGAKTGWSYFLWKEIELLKEESANQKKTA